MNIQILQLFLHFDIVLIQPQLSVMSILHSDHNIKNMVSIFFYKTDGKSVGFLIFLTAKSYMYGKYVQSCYPLILCGCRCQNSANTICAIIFLIICI